MQSKASTVEEYLDELSPDRRTILQAVRQIILKSVPKGIEEGMQYGMIGYYVPHSLYPKGYHCDPKQPLPFVNLASQKNYCSLYLFGVYGAPELREAFIAAYRATGKKLDMGSSCVRFKSLDNLPLDLIKSTIKKMKLKEYIANYEASLAK